MAAARPTRSFQQIQGLFYTKFQSNDLYGWALERVPIRHQVNRDDLEYDGWFNEWLYAPYNARARFRCVHCIRSGIDETIATWTSHYTTLLFRATTDTYMDEKGIEWFAGWVQMREFTQRCRRCEIYITGLLIDDHEIERLVDWIQLWIGNRFYGRPIPRRPRRGGPRNRQPPHDEGRCEARQAGFCRSCHENQ